MIKTKTRFQKIILESKKFLKKFLPHDIANLLVKINSTIRNMSPVYFMLRHPNMFMAFRKFLYPKFLSIFLTTRCNIRCFICRREKFKSEDLNFENLYKLKEAIKYAKVIELTGWGESLTYPKFKEVLYYIYSLNKQVLISLTTNGTLLSADIAKALSGHIDMLKVSINAAKEDTYNRDMKGGNFLKTISNIKEVMSVLNEEDKSKVVLHFVTHTENFLEIPDLIILAKNLGIKEVHIGNYYVGIEEHIKYSLLNIKQAYNNIIDKAEALAKKLDIKIQARKFFTEKEREPNVSCQFPYNECFISVNGDVYPCCFCGSYTIGNAYKETFESVWFGEAYSKLRRARYLPICKSCNPFTAFDNPSAHFHSDFKERKDYKKIEEKFINL